MIKVGTTQVVKQNANNSELQAAIEAVIPQAVEQTKDIANRYRGKTEAETCKKIFNYLKNQINYKADGAEQQVRLPSGLIRTLQGDCKSYAVFTSAILSNLGIPHSLVYTSYDEKDATPTHIYVVTDKGCIIDAVYGKFNAEKKPTYKKLKPMNISYIAGIKSRKRIGSMGKYGTGGACGIGAVEGALEWAARNGVNLTAAQKIAIGAQKVLPIAIAGRAVLRNFIQKNAGGFATSLNKVMVASRSERQGQPNWDKMRAIELVWLNKGGNPNELYESIKEGASKTPTGYYFNKLLKMKAGGYTPNPAQWIAAGISALFGKKYDPATGKITGGGISGEPATDSAAVVATVPWWGTMIGTIITTLGLAYITSSANPAPGETLETGADTTDTGAGSGAGAGTGSTMLPLLLIGGAGVAAYYYFNKKK
jgi:hypothetical protein